MTDAWDEVGADVIAPSTLRHGTIDHEALAS
mgnify:CR=1 FL=1